MLEETQKLHQEGLSLQRMEELGLEYRFLARQIKGELTPEEMQEQLKVAIWRYAKRQLTWFKRDHRIEWFTPYSKQLDDIKQRVREFLGRY